MDHSDSDQFTHSQKRSHGQTSMQAHISKHKQMQKQTHKPPSSSSVSVCDWLVLVSCPAILTNDLEAAAPHSFDCFLSRPVWVSCRSIKISKDKSPVLSSSCHPFLLRFLLP
ncbi:hypothetical protein CHARACLAT_001979 [Characodon lateralis]|uniref:Uncharacterized protein n=1 Tax=Characodon lateralis TaxID=208331 RepID=A0ABU7EZH3_9TELE|nr:hypothetical protein [Characodon lateralis]